MTTDSADEDDFLLLADDDAAPEPEALGDPWPVLIVDDDPTIHLATQFALRDFRFAGRAIAFLNAYSAAEAREVLARHSGIACVLLDVVMETESAGLDLVAYIRDGLKNSEIRLILRTGQPGYAPDIGVIQDYDINDYKEKSYTTGEQLQTSLSAALRSYQQIQKIENLAFTDQLTGLPNGLTLIRQMSDRLDPARSHVLALVGIDNFESTNEGLGREAGDQLLRHVGSELSSFDGIDFVARAGGNVFGVLMPVEDRAEAVDRLQRVSEQLKRRLLVGSAHVAVGTTIGATLFQPGSVDPSAVIGNAGIALKQARQDRPAGFLLFEDSMNASLRMRLHLGARVHQAIEDQAFFLLYQPQVSLGSGRIVGVEALLRWRDGKQVLPPDQFIAVAESSGLILPLGKWVLDTALAQQQRWREQGWRVRMAVNLSTRQIVEDDSFVEFVRSSLQQHGAAPGELELEVTETMVTGDMESGIGRLRLLQDLGVQIAIDDFGTGYSSLGQLRHLPVNRLKIDRVFIQGLDTDPHDLHIAEMIIRMGHAVRLGVLAEGVETAAQRDILKSLQCDEVQGSLYAGPLGAAELPALFQRLGTA